MSPTVQPMASPSPTRPDCVEEKGIILQDSLTDPDLPTRLPFRIYLPPCYSENISASYPSLFLFHGLSMTDSQWDELGINERADQLITSDQLPPFLIVMPRHTTNQDFEIAITDYLVPFIDLNYRSRQDPSMRAIGGISRGAGWAFRIGLKHPELFGGIGLHSPAFIDSEYVITRRIEDLLPGSVPRLWIDIGEADSLLSSTVGVRELMTSLGVHLIWRLDQGGHNPEYWSSNIETYLRWYASLWFSYPN